MILIHMSFLVYSVFAWVVALALVLDSNSTNGAICLAAGVGLTYVFQGLEAFEVRERHPVIAPVQVLLFFAIVALWAMSVTSSIF